MTRSSHPHCDALFGTGSNFCQCRLPSIFVILLLGRSDSMTLAIAHRDGGRAILDATREICRHLVRTRC